MKKKTHSPPTTSAINTTNPIRPPVSLNLFASKKPNKSGGSGSTKPSRRPGSSATLGGFSGSKQYCLKHAVHCVDRGTTGATFSRARSNAAHCRHVPKLWSGVLANGVNPEIVAKWTCSKNSGMCLVEYDSLNVGVLSRVSFE